MSLPFGYKKTTKNTLIPAGSSFQVPLDHHSAMKAPILLSMATTTLDIICQEGKVKEFDKPPTRETREARVLTHLSDILRDDAKKSALRKLERSEVQLIVDYLDSVSQFLSPISQRRPILNHLSRSYLILLRRKVYYTRGNSRRYANWGHPFNSIPACTFWVKSSRIRYRSVASTMYPAESIRVRTCVSRSHVHGPPRVSVR